MEEKAKELVNLSYELTKKSVEYWKQYNLNSWRFWLLVGLIIIPPLIWWRFIDKKRIFQILILGLIIIILNMSVDSFGVHYGLWTYKYEVVPVPFSLLSLNFSAIPVIYMFVYQYAANWRKYGILLISSSLIIAYPMQLLMKRLNIYDDYRWWSSTWSFVILLIMGILAKLLTDSVIRAHEEV